MNTPPNPYLIKLARGWVTDTLRRGFHSWRDLLNNGTRGDKIQAIALPTLAAATAGGAGTSAAILPAIDYDRYRKLADMDKKTIQHMRENWAPKPPPPATISASDLLDEISGVGSLRPDPRAPLSWKDLKPSLAGMSMPVAGAAAGVALSRLLQEGGGQEDQGKSKPASRWRKLLRDTGFGLAGAGAGAYLGLKFAPNQMFANLPR